jgi:hypothetical protein
MGCVYGLYGLIGLCMWGGPAYAYKCVTWSFLRQRCRVEEEAAAARAYGKASRMNVVETESRMLYSGPVQGSLGPPGVHPMSRCGLR